ncbi:hypothetical protein JXZ92_01990 [Mycoplasma sp. CSL10137]|uniref:HinT-interacting membrane complex lipoprotein P60 n=1 Tax=unclassified Mycoplasma TaxID=2683645 RepID=UPI00197BFE01|nr:MULTISPECIES: hypothetical protein [unclassified Mycoplasma]MBN4083590.1 hypothetical protein [Mycoplasma sp. CSL10137]MBN4084129.1 hypothetical protein [Mycoplasma sp. CSL10166]MBU4692594.1 hypothetical protein [Mycoplasma sp. CSL7491-lung]
MIKWFKKVILPVSLASISVAAISCGRTADSIEKTQQDELFKDAKVKTEVENLWIENVLKNYYQVDENANLISNQEYKEAAFQTYKTYVEYQNQKDSKYLEKQITNLLSLGVLNQEEFKVLEKAYSFKSLPTLDQFTILYNNKSADVRLLVNKQLLVNKYLTISSKEELEKIDNSKYTRNKDRFDQNNFLLIDYILDKNYVQLWQFKSDKEQDLFTTKYKTISNINDYNAIALKNYTTDNVVSSNLLFSNNKNLETKLGGYVGIQKTPFSFDNSIAALSEDNVVMSGFYNYSTNKLVKVNEDESLEESIKITNNDGKINISYLNRIMPLTKKVTNPDDKEKEMTIFTMENTIFAPNLLILTTILSVNDESLYNKAVEAFVALGNKLTITENETLKKSLEGSKFLG